MFTRQHYITVAATIKKNPEAFLSPSVLTLARMFKADNPRFDAKTFFIACGFNPDTSEDESLTAILDEFNKTQ